MKQTILSLLPMPSDLLRLEPEQFGGILLELIPGVLENNQFNSEVLLNQLFPPSGTYPLEERRAVTLALAEAASWLVTQGLLLEDPQSNAGMYVLTRRAKALQDRADVEVYRKSRILPAELLHPALANKVLPLFMRGDYDVAVFQAFRVLEVEVRKTANAKGAGFPDNLVGKDLMRKAFNSANGPLTDMTLVDAEKDAESNLFAGAIGHAKNPPSHRDVEFKPQEAAQLVVFASYLLSIVEQRSK